MNGDWIRFQDVVENDPCVSRIRLSGVRQGRARKLDSNTRNDRVHSPDRHRGSGNLNKLTCQAYAIAETVTVVIHFLVSV